MNLFLKNGHLATEDKAPFPSDIHIENGTIQAIAPQLPAPQGAETIDCTDKLIMPSMFDAHVHFRQPGQEHKETIQSGTEAAINGGITGVVMMPNTAPAIDSATVVHQVLATAREHSRIPVFTSGCITKNRSGQELAAIHSMKKAGVLMLTDDGDGVPNPALLKRAMEYATEFGMFFASHCEVPELAGPRALNEGPTSFRLGIQGSPACAEEIAMDRDIRLAHATGAHLHIQHVSSALGMETIRWWKARGAKITAEVAPHHLLFKDEDIGDYDTHYKMNPPLRTAEDNAALLQGLKDGVFDLIATDHAPHSEFEKNLDFVNAPNGITGLETALISLYHHFIKTGELDWPLLIKRYSAEPRRLMQLPTAEIKKDQQAELLIFDPNGQTTFSKSHIKSLSSNTPFLDKTLDGAVEHVILGDQILK